MERKIQKKFNHICDDKEVVEVTVYECGCTESKYHINPCKNHEHIYNIDCSCELCTEIMNMHKGGEHARDKEK